jgi:N6-adenosine-specific RNA methylase IME4
MSIRDEAERLKLYARQAKDGDLLANAAEIHLRAERQLGVLLAKAKEAGQIGRGQPPKNSTEAEEFTRITLADAGIDHKLSAKAQKMAGLGEGDFEDLVDEMRNRILSGGAILVDRLTQTQEKQARRAQRERELGEKLRALPDKKYGVILADPEWRFEPWSRATGLDRSADNHYPTSCTEVIASRDVPSIAAEDCVLWLWVPAPMLLHGAVVMAAWGFDYKSNYVWAKDKIGTGYWNREKHEHLLIGTRGSIPAPAVGSQWESMIYGPREAHSQKPELFLTMIEFYYPTVPKIELNRRGRARPGWDTWGDEAEPTDSSSN